MHKTIRKGLLLLAASVALQAAASEAVPAQGQVLDSVVVQGESLSDLRIAVTRAQDSFIALYNKVNPDRSQRMTCRDEANTGSRMTQRRCSTRGQDDKMQEAARSMLNTMGVNAGLDNQESGRAAEAAVAQQAQGAPAEVGPGAESLAAANERFTGADSSSEVQNENQKFNKTLQDLLDKNPELQKRADAYFEAVRRYEAARKRK